MQLNLLYQEQKLDQCTELISETHLWDLFNRCRNPCQFAVNIARILFTPEELRESNCRGVKDRNPLDIKRLNFIRHVVLKFYNISESFQTRVWKECIRSIDTRCRHERRLSFL